MDSAAGCRHVVVVVEDETFIRLFTCEALVDAGFNVFEAQHADEALDILRARGQQVHALFTDVHLPGSIDGLALAHLSRATWPWIVLLIASGRARPLADEMPVASRFLPKPYETDRVVRHLREMIPA